MSYFDGFGYLKGRFALKFRCRNQPREMVGPSRARSAEKDGNMTARGCIWEYFEARWGLLGMPLTSLGTVLASTWGPQALFFTTLLEKRDLCISTPLSHGIAIIAGPGTQVGATRGEKLSPIGPECPRSGIKGIGTVKFGRSVRSCCESY